MKTNIFRIQPNNSIMCGFFCIGFIDFMFAGNFWLILLVCFHLTKKMTIWFWDILKMNKDNFTKSVNTSDLSDQTKFW